MDWRLITPQPIRAIPPLQPVRYGLESSHEMAEIGFQTMPKPGIFFANFNNASLRRPNSCN